MVLFVKDFLVNNKVFRSVYNRLSPQHQEMIRFFFVGGSLTLGWILLVSFLDKTTGLRPAITSAIAYSIMITIGYFAQRMITFRADNNHTQAFFSYTAVQMIGLVLSVIFSELFIKYFQLQELLGLGEWGRLISFGSVGIVTAVINFVLLKYWTFRKQKRD